MLSETDQPWRWRGQKKHRRSDRGGESRPSERAVGVVLWVGDKTVHATEGTVEDLGEGSKTVAVKTADGAKETFVVADHALVNSGKDIASYSARDAKKGEHVTVYYAQEAGKKIAHVFRHL